MKKTKKHTLIDSKHNILNQSINVKHFDKNNNVALEIEEIQEGVENWRKVSEYESNLETETLFVGDEIVQTNQITRNSSGKKLKEITTINDEQIIYAWILDQQNNLITEEEYDIEGALIVKTIKHLNSDGKIIKEVEGSDYQTNYEYVNGRVSNVKIIDEGTLNLEENHYYDDNGNEIRSLGMDHQLREEIEVKKTYNPHNKIIGKEVFMNGIIEYTEEYEYNSDHDLIRIESHNLMEGLIGITEITIE